MTTQLERIAAATGADPNAVAIYELDDGRCVWPYWLHPACAAKRVKSGAAIKSRKDAPHELPCDDCSKGKQCPF